MDLKLESIQGVAEGKVEHQLTLDLRSQPGKALWRCVTTMEGEARHSRLSRMPMLWPDGYRLDERAGFKPAGLVQGVPAIDPQTHQGAIRLLYTKPGPFKISFEGALETPLPDDGTAKLALPFPQGMQDRGATVSIQLPENLEIVANPNSENGPEVVLSKPQNLVWRFSRIPKDVEIKCRPYTPEFAVRNVADVALAGNQMHVRHRFWIDALNNRPARIRVRISEKTEDAVFGRTDGVRELL
jgi:hypothetical protein